MVSGSCLPRRRLSSRAAEPLRYLSNTAAVFRAVEFEGAISQFIEQVQGQLRAEKVAVTNLESVGPTYVESVQMLPLPSAEGLEALLGFDPDEAEVSLLEDLVAREEISGRALSEKWQRCRRKRRLSSRQIVFRALQMKWNSKLVPETSFSCKGAPSFPYRGCPCLAAWGYRSPSVARPGTIGRCTDLK